MSICIGVAVFMDDGILAVDAGLGHLFAIAKEAVSKSLRVQNTTIQSVVFEIFPFLF